MSPPPLTQRVQAFLQGLRELGWVEGQNTMIEYRYADGQLDRLKKLAAELIVNRVDVIVAQAPAAVGAAKSESNTIYLS